jgi:hypothetical protein
LSDDRPHPRRGDLLSDSLRRGADRPDAAEAEVLSTPRHPARHPRVAVIVSLVVLALAGVLYAQVWPDLESFVLAIDHCDKLFCDFTNHYYPMAVELYRTRTPVGGYFYSPLFAVLLAPLRRLPLEQALQVWGGVQAVLLLLFMVTPHGTLSRRLPGATAGYIALVAFSQPVLHNTKWGQVSVLMTLTVLMAFELYRRELTVPAAVVLAFGVWIKAYTAIMLIYFVLRRDLKFLLVFAAASVVFALVVPLGALGVSEGLAFYRDVSRAVNDATSWVVHDVNSQYFVHVVNRYAGGELGGATMAWLRLLGYAVAALNLLLAALVVHRRLAHEARWVLVLLFGSLPFMTATSWPHYFVYLPFCHAVLALALVRSPGRVNQKRTCSLRVRTLQAGLLLLPSIVLASAPFFIWIGDWRIFSTRGFLFFSNLLVLILTYMQLWNLCHD